MTPQAAIDLETITNSPFRSFIPTLHKRKSSEEPAELHKTSRQEMSESFALNVLTIGIAVSCIKSAVQSFRRFFFKPIPLAFPKLVVGVDIGPFPTCPNPDVEAAMRERNLEVCCKVSYVAVGLLGAMAIVAIVDKLCRKQPPNVYDLSGVNHELGAVDIDRGRPMRITEGG